MNTFYQLIHKENSITKKYYSWDTKNNSRFEYSRHYWENEAKLSTDIVNLFLHNFTSKFQDYSTEIKFGYLVEVRNNIFSTDDIKFRFLERFCSAQRKYWALTRLVYRYKFQKATCLIQKDLILNPIRETQHNVITILQHKTKYLFTVLDLRNIIENALCHSPNFFADPLPPKNPYNNLPFNKSTLYHIYFFMKRGDFVMSEIFHKYFLSNFNLKEFQDQNEVIIRAKYLENYLKTASLSALYDEAYVMLELNFFTKRLRIHEDFPKKEFVDILRPYLKIYFNYMYSLDLNLQHRSFYLMNESLKKFYKFNPKFGMKYLHTKPGEPQMVVTFDTKHLPFREERQVKFHISHLQVESDDSSSE